MSALATQAPHVEWAQRKDGLFVTIKIVDATAVKVDLTATSLTFEATGDETPYAFSYEFFGEVLPEESKWMTHARNMQMHIVKADKGTGHWPRLFKDKAIEKQFCSADWSRYVDEDEEADDGGFDMSSLEGAAGFGGDAEEPYEPDSDDDVDLGDLDEPPK
ncbi:HSP20-like chaperone [Pelagophyceae sp. CCMP2097]|nr:HSP20-like chaperone [Pelagophyceae sp. CCMP2097]